MRIFGEGVFIRYNVKFSENFVQRWKMSYSIQIAEDINAVILSRSFAFFFLLFKVIKFRTM